MCEECEQESARVRAFSRRAWLALTAGGLGAVVGGLWSCRSEPKKPAEAAPGGAANVESGPASTEVHTTQAATTRARAPDLGAALFPDAAGRPIAQASDAPVIVIPRSDWTHAGPNLDEIVVMDGVSRMTVHHTAGELSTDAWKATAGTLEAIRDFHTGKQPEDRGWADIAYHFVVDRAGRVWQARPLAYQGAHCQGHNEHNIGIVLLGNFEVQMPAAAQLVSLAAFIGFLRRLYGIPVGEIYTHRELRMTVCPGKNLQAYMDRERRKWKAEEGGRRQGGKVTR
ncbi:MAG TPA: peptidoglycan recognition family protein [Phycisphaerae bacterium]|nr:peptidoglycan recognition family protein [Phycisphaerae bacterium]